MLDAQTQLVQTFKLLNIYIFTFSFFTFVVQIPESIFLLLKTVPKLVYDTLEG